MATMGGMDDGGQWLLWVAGRWAMLVAGDKDEGNDHDKGDVFLEHCILTEQCKCENVIKNFGVTSGGHFGDHFGITMGSLWWSL